MDCWNDKDYPMWMIHLMVCLEWLLNNAFTLTTNYLCYIHTHDLTWNGLDMCSKLWSKCLPFRASLWAFLSAFYWRFCLVGLSVYSYPGLEAHVCDGFSGCKQYVSCFRLLLILTVNKLRINGHFVNSIIRPGHTPTPSLLCYRFQFSSFILLLHFRHWPG